MFLCHKEFPCRALVVFVAMVIVVVAFFFINQQMTQILVLHHRVAIKRHSPISFHFNSHIVEFADTLVHLYFSRSFLCRFTLIYHAIDHHSPHLCLRIEQQIEPRNHHLSTLHCPLIVIRIAMGLLIGGGGWWRDHLLLILLC